MNASLPYLICGVTGRTGAATAEALLRAGLPVRVMVRTAAQGAPWAARGAQVAVAELSDLAALTEAFTGVAGAYVLSPQQYQREDLFTWADQLADNIARAGVAASVPKLVALSSVGADRASGTGWIAMNRALEQRLSAIGVASTFLRAAYFMENWAGLVAYAASSGSLPSFLAPTQRALPMVATADVGSAAAALLQQQWQGQRVVTLAGPVDYAPDDVAAAVGAALGRPVGVAVLPESAWPDALAGAQFSANALAGFVAMTRGMNNGHIAIDSDAAALAWNGATTLQQLISALVNTR